MRRLSKVSPIWQGDPELEDAQKGDPTRPQVKQVPEAYFITPAHPKRAKTRSFPWEYVQDACEPRTKLGDFFSILFTFSASYLH